MNNKLETPILFVIFNRPDTTEKVFNEIKKIKPKKLFVSADGPRENKPFDLVYSNYVLQKLKNKEQLIKTAHDNLKKHGWFFIHTFDKSDPNGKSDLTADFLKKLLERQGFKNITAKIFDFYDDEAGHKHWHKILEGGTQK